MSLADEFDLITSRGPRRLPRKPEAQKPDATRVTQPPASGAKNNQIALQKAGVSKPAEVDDQDNPEMKWSDADWDRMFRHADSLSRAKAKKP